MTSQPGSARASLLLALASLVFALVVGEAVARVALRAEAKGKGDGQRVQYHEHDPLLGWRNRPGASAVFDRPEYRVEVRINSLGLRDPERTVTPPPGTFRIIALGDSFIEAYSVPLPESVTQVLERSLTAPGCPTEVLNGGTTGWGTDQEYLFYRRDGWRYGAKVVVLFFYFNDVFFNGHSSYFGTPKPVLVERRGELVLEVDPVPPLPSRTPRPERPSPEGPSGSVLLAWARGRLLTGAPRAYNALAQIGLWPEMRPEPPPEQHEVYQRQPSPDIEAAWQKTARILAAFDREVRAKEASLLLVYIPSRMEVSDRDLELTRLRYQMSDRNWDVGKPAAQLRDIASSLAVPLLDLTPALRRANRGMLGEPYFVQDGHWNALGHRVAAEEVERALRERGWVPPCPPAAAR